MKIIANLKAKKNTDIALFAEKAIIAGADGIYIKHPQAAKAKKVCQQYGFQFIASIPTKKYMSVKQPRDYKRAAKIKDKIDGIIDGTKTIMIVPLWKTLIKSMDDGDGGKYISPNEFRAMVRNIRNYQAIFRNLQ